MPALTMYRLSFNIMISHLSMLIAQDIQASYSKLQTQFSLTQFFPYAIELVKKIINPKTSNQQTSKYKAKNRIVSNQQNQNQNQQNQNPQNQNQQIQNQQTSNPQNQNPQNQILKNLKPTSQQAKDQNPQNQNPQNQNPQNQNLQVFIQLVLTKLTAKSHFYFFTSRPIELNEFNRPLLYLNFKIKGIYAHT